MEDLSEENTKYYASARCSCGVVLIKQTHKISEFYLTNTYDLDKDLQPKLLKGLLEMCKVKPYVRPKVKAMIEYLYKSSPYLEQTDEEADD